MQTLDCNEVQIWYANVEDFKSSRHFDSSVNLLSANEFKHYSNMQSENEKNQYLLARFLLKNKLSMYFSDIAPDKWKFNRNEYGKPTIANSETPTWLNFNLAHTRDMVVCAFSGNPEVGVDIENRNQDIAYRDIAKSIFSSAEFHILANLKFAEGQNQFFKFWTLKEAYIKAKGLGLQISLDQFSFQIENNNDVQVIFKPEMKEFSENWKFKLLNPTNDCQIAVALQTSSKLSILETEYLFD